MYRKFVPTVAELRQRMEEKKAGKEPVALVKNHPRSITLDDIRQGVDQIFRKHGVEPTEEVIRILQERGDDGEYRLSRSERAKIWLELMQYRHPKLKSVEHSGAIKSDMTLVVMRFSDGKEIERKPLQLDHEAIEVEQIKSSEMAGAPEVKHSES